MSDFFGLLPENPTDADIDRAMALSAEMAKSKPCAYCGHQCGCGISPIEDVCEACCEMIANFWWNARSGRYLTWPNERPAAGYRKDVISRSLAKQVFERDAYRCIDCGTHIDLCCDHVIPESKGGPTTLDNLQTMCRRCNSRKGVRT